MSLFRNLQVFFRKLFSFSEGPIAQGKISDSEQTTETSSPISDTEPGQIIAEEKHNLKSNWSDAKSQLGTETDKS